MAHSVRPTLSRLWTSMEEALLPDFQQDTDEKLMLVSDTCTKPQFTTAQQCFNHSTNSVRSILLPQVTYKSGQNIEEGNTRPSSSSYYKECCFACQTVPVAAAVAHLSLSSSISDPFDSDSPTRSCCANSGSICWFCRTIWK